MKAALLPAYDKDMNVQLRIEDVPDPRITGPDDVIVRVGAAGLCRTDLHIMEGIWKPVMDPEDNLLPYIMGHENAGWVEEVGSHVTTLKPGDAVISHPLVTCGVCTGCRKGEDMYCEHNEFPGLSRNGGFAEHLLTKERALIKLNENVAPVSVAPLADAGITAYRAARRAAEILRPGQYVVVMGVGGLGHIAIQSLRELCGARIIAVDLNDEALSLARELGAAHAVKTGPNVVEEIHDLTHGGAQVVLDFVGELGAEQQGWNMLCKGGTDFIIGYGGELRIPTLHMIINEISVCGSLVGNYRELSELMELNAEGKVNLHSSEYPLEQINDAIDDLKNRRLVGRGVIVPN